MDQSKMCIRDSPYTLRLHIVEADRTCTPSEYGGGVTKMCIRDRIDSARAFLKGVQA